MCAWRPNRNLREGELDNTTPGVVTGWMSFVGLSERVTFRLSGDFHRDIRGAVIRFKNPSPVEPSEDQEQFTRFFARLQTGDVGDITAGLPPCDYVDYPYIEWYSDHNGRVVLELKPEQVEVIGTPLPWKEEEAVSRDRQAGNMLNFLAGLGESLGKAK